jgi:CubicO group peptidase (beta-lactamase class C family)
MMLHERGQLRLEQRLSDYYPAIPGGDAISIRQLLSHTSGLHDYVRGGLPMDVARDWTTADEFAAGVARMLPLQDFAPGTWFSYSNTGYILLGGVVEKASGLSYERFVTEKIFQPCGMGGTAVDHDADVVPGRADGYALENGKAWAFRHPATQKLPFAAGAVRSTVVDMARWSQCFLAGRIVSPASVQEMIRPARVSGGALVGDARWWPPGFDPGRPPVFARDDNYGLGWESTTFYGQRTVGHNGGIAGYNAILTHYLDRDLTLVLLANSENGIIAPAFSLMQQIAAM